LGCSPRVSPFDELAVERRLLEDENDAGRLEGGAPDEFVFADDDDVVYRFILFILRFSFWRKDWHIE
jgi:hypothetical protein